MGNWTVPAGLSSGTYGTNANGGMTYTPVAQNALARNTSLAGQTVYNNGVNVSYNADGYAVNAVNPGHSDFAGTNRGVRAQSIDAARRVAEGRADPNDLDSLVMSDRNLQDRDYVRQQIANGSLPAEAGNAEIERLRGLYGYSGGDNGATYAKLALTTFDPNDVTTQPYSKEFRADPNTDWSVWRQESVAGPGYAGPVSGLQDGQFAAPSYAGELAAAGYSGSGTPAYGTPYADALAAYGSGGVTPAYGTPYTDALAAYGGEDWLRELLSLYNGDESAYEKLMAANEAAKEAAVQKALNGIEAQRAQTNSAYDDLYRQAYIDKMNAQKDLEQRLAAYGITGGETESTLLGMETAYADAKRRAEQQRLGEMADYDLAASDARLNGDLELANARSAAQKEQTARRAELLQYALDRYDKLAKQYRDDQLAQQQLALSAAQADRNYQLQLTQRQQAEQEAGQAWARQIAETMLNNGTMPDEATLAAAGLTAEQARALLPETETAAYTPTFTAAQVLSAAEAARKSGTTLSGNLLRDYNWYNYGDPDYGMAGAAGAAGAADGGKSVDELAREVIAGKWGNGDARRAALAAAGYDAAAVQQRVNALVKAKQKNDRTEGMDAASFNLAGNGIRENLQAGNVKAAQDAVNAIWDKLSNAQQETMWGILNQFVDVSEQ